MHPSDSADTFQHAVAASHTTVENLDAQHALERMLAFYRDVRAENCDQSEEGDTLCWQWGTYAQPQGANFQVELARHFIEPGNEDEDGMSELSLTLQYAPTDKLEALGRGRYECGSPEEIKDFESAVLASPVYRAVASLKPRVADLEWHLE